MVYGSLVRMHELVNLEVVLVEYPGAMGDMVPEGGQSHVIHFFTVLFLIGGGEPGVPIDCHYEDRDFEGWDKVTLAGPCIPIQGWCRHTGFVMQPPFLDHSNIYCPIRGPFGELNHIQFRYIVISGF